MTIITAEVAIVQLGLAEIEGLRGRDGKYYIAIPQIADLTKTSRNTAARDFKRLMGKDFKTSDLKTPFNKSKTIGISLSEFERLLVKLDRNGNTQAQLLRDSLTGLALYQLFADAFGQQLTSEDRQRFLFEWHTVREYAKGVHSGFKNACYDKYHPGNLVHDYMTVLIFGDTAKAARMKALVDDSADPEIGLNHQEDIEGMRLLARAKVKYTNKKMGTWQEQVEWAVREALNT